MQHRASHGIGVIACLSLAITAACREVDVVAADVARIEIEPTEVELRPGQVRQFTVVLTSEEGDRLAGRTIEWASADPDVATVDADGRVEARGTGETHFVVERKSRKDGAWKHVAELPANTSTHMDRGLEEETRYWYRVLACRDSRCAASGEVSERTKDD
jgi:phosphodiesterase/alkaline phosphatase D-like protein